MKLTRKTLAHCGKPVDFKWPQANLMLAQTMFALMRKEGGIGLASTQVGLTKRLFVMNVNGCPRTCFNPEITESSTDLVDFDEGCLSFPGEQCTIARPSWIRVKYQQHNGEYVEDVLTGLEAVCFQHELDHINGITMLQRYKEQNAEQSGN